jgi:MFS family permease
MAQQAALLSPLRRPAVRLVTIGQALSTLGDMFFLVALPFLLVGGADPVHVGAPSLATTLAVLGVARVVATPVGGMLADRWHPRTVMLIADGGRSVGILLFLPVFAARPLLWQLVVGALVVGVLEGLFLPAYRAVMPSLVPGEELAAANAVGESASVVAVVVGPLVAGVAVLAFGPAVAIGINAVTFAVSAALLALVRPIGQGGEAEPMSVTGLRGFVKATPLFSAVLVIAGVLGLTTAAVLSVALPLLAASQHTDGARVFGYLLAANGVGMLAGALLAGGVRWPVRRGLVAVGLLAMHGLLMAGLPHVPLAVQLLAVAGLGLIDGVLSIMVLTLVQTIAPKALLGRAMAALTLVRTGVYPLAAALAGALIAAWGNTPMFLVAGAGAVLAALAAAALPAIREAR